MLKCKLGNTFGSEGKKNSQPLLHMLAYFKTGTGDSGEGGEGGSSPIKMVLSGSGSAENAPTISLQ